MVSSLWTRSIEVIPTIQDRPVTAFGNGVHTCIGMYFGALEVKAAMHQLLQRFWLTVEPDYRTPIDSVSLPRPKDGLPIQLHRL
jgi:cytochrome P450